MILTIIIFVKFKICKKNRFMKFGENTFFRLKTYQKKVIKHLK